MGTINPAIPTIGDPNSTEDPDVRSALVTIRDAINGALDTDNVATGGLLIADIAAATYGSLVIAGNEANPVYYYDTQSADITATGVLTGISVAPALGYYLVLGVAQASLIPSANNVRLAVRHNSINQEFTTGHAGNIIGSSAVGDTYGSLVVMGRLQQTNVSHTVELHATFTSTGTIENGILVLLRVATSV